MQQSEYTIEGVLFDLDGTLMDTASDFVTVIHQMLADENLPLLDANIIRDNVSAGSRQLMQLAYQLDQDDPKTEARRDQFLTRYDHLIKQPERNKPAQLYPGIPELLDRLDQKNIPWGIVTNKPEPYALILLEQHRLVERSHTIICPEHVSEAKPSPEALLLACRQANCSPEASLYIGDHDRDIVAGRRAGMFTITAHYGYITQNQTPYDWQADHNIHCATELLPWINNNNWTLSRSSGVKNDV